MFDTLTYVHQTSVLAYMSVVLCFKTKKKKKNGGDFTVYSSRRSLRTAIKSKILECKLPSHLSDAELQHRSSSCDHIIPCRIVRPCHDEVNP